MSTRFLRHVFHFALGLAAAALARAADATDNIEWVSISLPTSGGAGAMLQFNATVKNTGTTTWDGNCYLELKDATSGAPIDYPSVAGVAPGQTVSRMFLLYLPTTTGSRSYTFKGMRHNVAYFGPTQTRTISIVAGAVNQGVTLAGPQNASGSHILDTASLPIINSPDALTPNYRLRAKIIDGSYMGWGHHAATTWNNKGLRLDSAPATPGTYPVTSLYWLKYDAFEGTLLEIGPERFVSVNVPGGTVQLEYYSFGNLTPPLISSNEPTLAGTTYWLDATFVHPTNGQQWLATPRPANAPQGSHNNNQPLNAGALPPPGDYNLKLSWRRFDGLGNLFATGPDFPVNNVVIYQGQGPVLSVSGNIEWVSGQDDEGNWGGDYSVGSHNFSTSIAGTVSISISTTFNAAVEVNDGYGNLVASGSGSVGFGTAGGEYTLTIRTADGSTGSYTATADVFGGATAPSYPSTTDSVAGEFGKLFNYDANAGGTGTSYSIDSGQLPPGLALSGNGTIVGWPTAATPAGGPYVATIRAQNSVGHAFKTITFMIAKARPVAEFPGLIVQNQNLWPITQDMLTGSAAASSFKLGRPNNAPEHVPLPTFPSPVRFTAQSVRNPALTYDPFTPASVAGYTVAYGELRVTAHYAGDSNYEPHTATTSFWNKDTLPPIPPVSLNFQLVALSSSGFGVTWQSFTDNWGAAGGYPQAGISYEVSLAGRPEIVNTASPSVRFNSLTAGTTYTVQLRAKDPEGNTYPATGWHPQTYNVTVPTSNPAAASTWADVDGDGIKDELIADGVSLDFASYDAEVGHEFVTTVNVNWPVGFWFGIQRPDWPSEWTYYITGNWQPLIEFNTFEVDLLRPGFFFRAEPGYDYGVVAKLTLPGNNIGYGKLTTRSIYEPAGGIAGVIHEVILGQFFPVGTFSYSPVSLVRYSKPVGSAVIQDGVGNILAANAVVGGPTVDLWLPANGNITLQLKDLSNNFINPSSGPVTVQIVNAIGAILRSAAGTTINLDGLAEELVWIRILLHAGSPVSIPVRVLTPRIAVKTMGLNGPGGVELATAKKMTIGAFVPLNDDDDDYDANNTADKDQAGSITGENDLLPITLTAISSTGAVYTLDIPPSVKIWTNPNRSGPVAGTATATPTQINANNYTLLYVEGVQAGTGTIKLNVTIGNTNRPAVDQAKVTVFSMVGPLNVPGYAIYRYTASGTGLPESTWLDPVGGSISTRTSDTDIKILWGAGGGTTQQKAVFKASGDYTWGLDVNVVRIELASPAHAIGENQLLFSSEVIQGTDRRMIIAGDAHLGGSNAMLALLNIASIVGPSIGGATRGEKFIELGFVQNSRTTRLHSNFDGFAPMQRRISTLQEAQFYLDTVPGSEAPWYSTSSMGLGTVGFFAATGARTAPLLFQVSDSPALLCTDVLSASISDITDAVDSFGLEIDFNIYFAIRTSADKNLSAQAFTQRARASWKFDGSGTVGANSIWSRTGSGLTGNSSFMQITDGSLVPVTTPPTANSKLPGSWSWIPR